MTTVAVLIEEVAARFADAELYYGHGTDNAWDEAVALVLQVSGVADDQTQLATALDQQLQATIREIARQRVATRAPLAHLLGRCVYAGYEFEVTPQVIVPRSPIGHLFDGQLEPWLPRPITRVLDLCCGSGCLGIVAAHHFKEAHVTMVEIEPSAVALAKRNVANHGLKHRVKVISADVAEFMPSAPYDLIISNPPYVNAQDMQDLPVEYQAEPTLALAAGADGLSIMSIVLNRLPEWITPHGVFLGEVGGSADALAQAYTDLPFIWLDLVDGGEGVFLLTTDTLTTVLPSEVGSRVE